MNTKTTKPAAPSLLEQFAGTLSEDLDDLDLALVQVQNVIGDERAQRALGRVWRLTAKFRETVAYMRNEESDDDNAGPDLVALPGGAS